MHDASTYRIYQVYSIQSSREHFLFEFHSAPAWVNEARFELENFNVHNDVHNEYVNLIIWLRTVVEASKYTGLLRCKLEKYEIWRTWVGTCEDPCPYRACNLGMQRGRSRIWGQSSGPSFSFLDGWSNCGAFYRQSDQPTVQLRSTRRMLCGR